MKDAGSGLKGDMKIDEAKSFKNQETNFGVDIKSGFNSSKIEIDGFKGRPAKIDPDGEYFSPSGDESQVKEYKENGYDVCSKSEADSE